MHLRRAVLLFALVLGLTALATAIAPTPPPPDDTAAPVPPAQPVEPPTTVTFRAPPAARPPRAHRVKPDAHVIVEVESAQGGQVTIPKLGRVAAVAGGSPARFDLLDIAPGRYDVLFEPALAPPVRVGTLVSSL